MVALVLLPGLDGTGRLFSEFAEAFGPEIDVIVASYPTTTPLGYAELESVARSYLPQDQPFYLLAESFSGPIGISIAASSPPGLLGLILCCSFARNPAPRLARFGAIVGIVPMSLVPVRILGFALLGRFRSSAHLLSLADALSAVAVSVLRTRIQEVLNVDTSLSLPQVRVPILYLRASEDRIVSRASSAFVASLARQIKIVEFVAPHFLLQVAPSEVASAVSEFMEERHGH